MMQKRSKEARVNDVPSTYELAEVSEEVDGFSRRRFLASAGATVAGASVLGTMVRPALAASRAFAGTSLATGLSGGFAAVAAGPAAQALAASDLLGQVGGTLRFPIRWDRVQTDEYVFDWSDYEALHQELVFSGLKGLPVIVGCPDWLDPARGGRGLPYPRNARALEALGQFAASTLSYFSRFGDSIDAVEVWSGPNDAKGNFVSSERFGEMVGAVSSLISEENSAGRFRKDMQVVAGSLVLAESNWPSYARALPAAKSDVAGVQVIASASGPTESRSAFVGRIRDELTESLERLGKLTQKPIWITDARVAPPNGSTAAADAGLRALVDVAQESEACAMLLGGGLYSPADDVPGAPRSALPLVTPDGTPTALYTALAESLATT